MKAAHQWLEPGKYKRKSSAQHQLLELTTKAPPYSALGTEEKQLVEVCSACFPPIGVPSTVVCLTNLMQFLTLEKKKGAIKIISHGPILYSVDLMLSLFLFKMTGNSQTLGLSSAS